MQQTHRRLAVLALALLLAVPAQALAARVPPSLPLLWEPVEPVRMRFDAGLGVHVVQNHLGVYYFDRSFMRLRAGRWQSSASATGPWQDLRLEWVPFHLRMKHYADER